MWRPAVSRSESWGHVLTHWLVLVVSGFGAAENVLYSGLWKEMELHVCYMSIPYVNATSNLFKLCFVTSRVHRGPDYFYYFKSHYSSELFLPFFLFTWVCPALTFQIYGFCEVDYNLVIIYSQWVLTDDDFYNFCNGAQQCPNVLKLRVPKKQIAKISPQTNFCCPTGFMLNGHKLPERGLFLQM